jgi:indolepyruvate ferredoxin oxidoreductase
LDDGTRERLGLSIYKVGMPWPLEPQGIREFAQGHERLLVVEEQRGLIEEQMAAILYPLDERPRLLGKFDEQGRPLLPVDGELNADLIAETLAERLLAMNPPEDLAEHLQQALARLRTSTAQPPASAEAQRSPWFCAGCPHNTSTRVPEGSRAFAGIGCHTMAMLMPNRRTERYTHMGGEGAQWIGMAPFSKDKHVFQNLGDGTYFHSGLMALRAAVAAEVNITYKILFNDAVAMTGGQPIDGKQTPWGIAQQVHAEGVKKIVVVTDEPDKYPAGTPWPDGVKIRHRRELDLVQRELREIPGVTVLVYDQTCAAEKRRRRKRGKFPDPPKRVFINEAVCEGCGDCGVVSNCVAVKPLQTEFGRKRLIDQSSCNKDYSCVEGFCPSFVTVHGGGVRKPAEPVRVAPAQASTATLPEPQLPVLTADYNILVTGIGGTGVITVGALLGMAAHLEGKGASVLDQTGLAQKNGAVTSHVRLSAHPADLHGTRIARGSTDLVLGCDMVVAAGQDALQTYAAGRTRAVINNHVVPLAAFALNPDMPMDGGRLVDQISATIGRERANFVVASRLATALMGDAIYANPLLMGYAWQQGLIPLSREALERAIELNGVAVAANKQAFEWGRRAAHAPEEVEALARPRDLERTADVASTLEEIIARRVTHLTAYQSARYARRYEKLVRRVEQAEQKLFPGEDALARAAAYYYAKLLAYKDEYEVARLYVQPEFRARLASQFEGGYSLKVHLAPPLLAKRDPVTGQPRKRAYGPWVFKLFAALSRLRTLRGTPLDPFGYTAERRTERRLIREYETLVRELIQRLDRQNYALAVELLSIPEHIRGFGHIKQRHLEEAKRQEAALLARLRGEAPVRRVKAAQPAPARAEVRTQSVQEGAQGGKRRPA